MAEKPILIADDYAAIAKRLRQIERPKTLVLPDTVLVIVHDSPLAGRLSQAHMTTFDLCFLLRPTLLLRRIHTLTGTYCTRDGINTYDLIKAHFPSAAGINDIDITLSPHDADRMREMFWR